MLSTHKRRKEAWGLFRARTKEINSYTSLTPNEAEPVIMANLVSYQLL